MAQRAPHKRGSFALISGAFSDLRWRAIPLLFSLCALLSHLTFLREAYAYPITLSFKTASGQSVPNIKIRGTRGINNLPILVSDANGSWTFDTSALSALDGVIVFSGVNAGMQLSPSEVRVADLVAQGVRSRLIRADLSATPSTIISWSFYSSGSTPLTNQPVSLLNPYAYACEARVTDQNGYVVWSVPKPRGRCDDASSDTSWYHIVPYEASGSRCANFVTFRSGGSKSCPYLGDDEAGISSAGCSTISNPAPTSASKIKVSVLAAGTTNGVQSVEIVGNSNLMALSSRRTDAQGNFTFSIGSVPGATASTAFDITPIASGYEFIPRSRDSRECAFSGSDTYTCEFSAIRTSASQGVLMVDVTQGGQPLSGVSIIQPSGLGCLSASAKFSDLRGRVVLPIRTRNACSTVDLVSWNDPVIFNPAMVGRRFTNESDFRYCPQQISTSAPVQAFDENIGVVNYSISGRVVGLSGDGLPGVAILMNGQEVSRSDSTGAFQVYPVTQGINARIEARLSPYSFDPEYETFNEVGQSISTTIFARAPDPFGGGIEPPEEVCPVQERYALRGRVLDRSGNPIVGASVHNNNGQAPATTTDSEGRFTLLVDHGSDNWVTIENRGSLFSPAGRSLVNTVCEESSLDYQEVDFESATISGAVLMVDSQGVSALPMKVLVNGQALGYDLRTGQDGSFMFTAPLGSQVVVAPDSTAYQFDPPSAGPLAIEADTSDISFRATAVPIVYPTTVPTAAPPSAPTAIPTLAPTVPGNPTQAPAPTALPTPPPGFQPTNTPIAAPTLPVATPVVPPSTTPTLVPPPQVTWNPTPSPTATNTAVPPIVPAPPTEPQPPVAPTNPPAPTFAPEPWPTTPPATSTPIPQPPVEPPSVTPTPPATATAEPLPLISLAARCGASVMEYDWIVENTGAIALNGGRWRVFDATQPSNYFEGGFINLTPGEVEEIFDTPGLGISPRDYRFAIYIVDSSGREVVVVQEGWDANKCRNNIETPTPVPAEPTASPTNPPPTAPTITPAPQPTAIQPPPSLPTPPQMPVMPPTSPQPPVPPVATETPVALPPPGTPPPTVIPTVTPTPSATPSPTVTPTPTPSYEISVGVRDWRNGRGMSPALFEQLIGRAELVIKGRGTDFEQRIPIANFSRSDYSFVTFVPRGSYRISFAGLVKVVSVFRRNASSYSCSVGLSSSSRNRCTDIRMALQPSSAVSRSSSIRGIR